MRQAVLKCLPLLNAGFEPRVSGTESLRYSHTFPGRLRGLFACMDFPTRRKNLADRPIFYKFCVYFPHRVRGTCVLVASAPRGIRASAGDGGRTTHIKVDVSSCYQEINSSIWGNQNELQILENLYGFADIENYLPIILFTDMSKHWINVFWHPWLPLLAWFHFLTQYG